MTIVADPMSEEAVADHAKQILANEDVVLRALRDHPDLSMARIAQDAGWLDADGKPEKWKVQRAIASLADDKLIHRARKGAPWTLTEKGKEVLEGGPTSDGNQPIVAVALHRSIPQQQQSLASGYGTMLRSCYGTVLPYSFRASCCYEGCYGRGVYPFLSSIVAVPLFRVPNCYGSRRPQPFTSQP